MIPLQPTSDEIAAARLLLNFVRRSLADATHPAHLHDELRFFLDVYGETAG